MAKTRLNPRSNSHAHVDDGVGQRIRLTRLEQGMSQRSLAVDGVSYAYISRLEAGHRVPTLSALAKIADVLGVTGLYLATGDDDAPCPLCHRGPAEAVFDGNKVMAATARTLEIAGRGVAIATAARRAAREVGLDDRQTDSVITAFNVLRLGDGR